MSKYRRKQARKQAADLLGNVGFFEGKKEKKAFCYMGPGQAQQHWIERRKGGEEKAIKFLKRGSQAYAGEPNIHGIWMADNSKGSAAH